MSDSTSSDPRFTTQGLPIWTWESIPGFITAEESEKYVKPWKTCGSCGVSDARYYCAGCANVTCVEKPRYCGRKCQKADWSRHEEECKKLKRLEDVVRNRRNYNYDRARVQQATRWLPALGASIKWAIRQAYLSNTSIDRSKTSLHLALELVYPFNPRSSLTLKFFEFEPKIFAPETLDGFGDALQHMGHFRISANDTDLRSDDWTSWAHVAPNDPILPQWPWILSLCCQMGDINPKIGKLRIALLARTIAVVSGENPSVQEFCVPPVETKWTMQDDSMDAWMRLMYPVTGSMQSAYHQPCDVVRRRYYHLLKYSQEP